MQAAAISDIVLPSFEDEADWFGDADPKATADRYLDAGAVNVIVKNGADPVLYADGSSYAEVPVPAVETLVDTTAAGDSFNAGIFACHGKGDTLASGITYACALSRQVVQNRGALVAFEPGSIR
jgi:2-dehydro-3-deoxygluconokinase